MQSCSSFSASRSLSIWWLELEVTPVTIDGPTVGNIEFSHKSYKSVLAVSARVASVPAALADDAVVALLLLCIACRLLPVARCPLPVANYLLSITTRKLLSVSS